MCHQILEKLQIIKGPANESVSPKPLALGETFATTIIEILQEWDFNEEEELYLPQENSGRCDKRVAF